MEEENINVNEDVSSIDDIGIDLPDIPMPEDNPQIQEIEDEFEGAYKFAIKVARESQKHSGTLAIEESA